MPPTSASAFQLLYRVYYLVQVWLGNELDPEGWDCKLEDNLIIWSQFKLYSRLLQKNCLILLFVNARRIVVRIVAVKKWDYFVRQYASIARVRLAPIMKQIQQMKILMILMKRRCIPFLRTAILQEKGNEYEGIIVKVELDNFLSIWKK